MDLGRGGLLAFSYLASEDHLRSGAALRWKLVVRNDNGTQIRHIDVLATFTPQGAPAAGGLLPPHFRRP